MMNLETFFRPNVAAFIGATEDQGKFGGRCFKRMTGFGFEGNIYAVNPKYSELFGRPCFPRIAALPEVPDHVGIVLPADRVLGAVKECIDIGVPFATIYSSGFSEDGTARGRELQQDLVETARAGNLRFMGPNCNGFVSFVHGFCMTTTSALAGPRATAGNIGIIAQSGGVGQVNVMYRAHELGLRISHQVSCGNQADIDVLDFAEFMINDPHTDVILVAVESLGDATKFRRVAELAAHARKPIVILKLGRTESGKRAVASHTGAITGSDAVCDAAFRQFGMIRVDDAYELNSMAMLFRQRRLPASRRAAAIAMSGGHSALFADLGDALGVQWPNYEQDTVNALRKVVPAFGATMNPTDITGANAGNVGAYTAALQAIANDPQVDVVIPILTIQKQDEINVGAEFALSTNKVAAVLWTGKCSDNPDLLPRTLIERGVPVFRDALPCLRAISAVMDYARFLRERDALPATMPRPADADSAQALRLLSAHDEPTLGESASRQILQAYGFVTSEEWVARTAQEAAAFAAQFSGRVVLKIESPDIQHKTEVGGVRLNLQAAEVGVAFDAMLAEVRSRRPDARIHGVLVQEMAAAGIEMIVGISSDITFGPVVSVGLGGIHVEVLKDVAHRIAPIDQCEAHAMLRELRGFALLQGVRGAAPADIEALVGVIVRLSWFGHDLQEFVSELDINPLRVMQQGQGVRILDALIVRNVT